MLYFLSGKLVTDNTQSEDDSADEDKQKEADRKKEEEAKAKAKAESKLPSGASSKGTNTPSGRPKHTDPLKKPKTNLKRSGSPNLSESSGNESSRKKLKKKHHASPGHSGTSTPVPGSRPMSPAPSGSQPAGSQVRKSSVIKLNVNPSKLSEIQNAPPNPSPVYGGSMSDGEATGGEMSDGGKKKKIKLRIGSPSGSRAGSPAPGRAGSIGVGGSRAGSPAAQGQSMQSTLPSPFLYLNGYFVGTTLEYRFHERWIQPRPIVPPEEVFYRFNSGFHIDLKLVVRSCLTEWLKAKSSASFLEYVQQRMGTMGFWRQVFQAHELRRLLHPVFHSYYTLPCSSGQFHCPTSTRYLSTLHGVLLKSVATGTTEAARAQSPASLGPITVQELIAAIPATGISSGALMRSFAGRVGDNPGQTDKKAFFQMVKEHSRYSADKLLRPK